MARKFFDQTLLESGTQEKKTRRRALTLPVSIAIHAIVLIALVVVPMLSFGDLPEPVGNNTVKAFFVEQAPPPPPPPPPPPAPAPAAPKPEAVKPKVEQPKVEPVKVPETPKFTAPVEVPKEIPKDEVADIGPAVAGGVEGGVPEGVKGGEVGGVAGGEVGGVKGGVVGGEVGGVVGGELGGVKGGVPGGVKEEPPAPPSGPVRVGGQVKAPRKIKNVDPRYSDLAREARVSGVVILECVIGTDGRVDKVKVLRGNPLLDKEAVEAVKQWVYSPTTLNGTAVEVIMTVTVNFKLQADSKD
jgi:protein TonB